MKYHVDALHSFEVMIRTKKGRMDERTDILTDGRTSRLLYATLRRNKIKLNNLTLFNIYLEFFFYKHHEYNFMYTFTVEYVYILLLYIVCNPTFLSK